MLERDDLVGRLAAQIREHSPRPVVVLVRHQNAARWLSSLLVERLGVVVGARVLDLEGLLAAGARELAGEGLSALETLARVRAALLADPERRYVAIADQPAYQREVLRVFVDLERSLAAERWARARQPSPTPDAPDATDPPALLAALAAELSPRDAGIVAAYERFCADVATLARERAPTPVSWRGRDLGRLLNHHARVGFLRPGRCAARIALGFSSATLARWEERLLSALDFERWDKGVGPSRNTASVPALAEGRPQLSLRLRCAGPEAEIAAVARWIRGGAAGPFSPARTKGRTAAVFAPAESIPRWVARLLHRDVPVRAYVETRARDTAAAQTARALMRVLQRASAPQHGDTSNNGDTNDNGEPTLGSRSAAVARADLEALLFGPALRPFSALAKELDVDFPRSVRPGDLRGAWEGQRAASASLGTFEARLRGAGEQGSEDLVERARRFGWSAEQLDARQARHGDAHRLLAAALAALARLARPEEPDAALPRAVRELLLDWGLLVRAAVHGTDGPEHKAARVIVDSLARTPEELSAEALGASLDHALSFARVGRWTHSRSVDGPPPVWVLAYETAAILDQLPPGLDAVVLAGLDAHPRAPRPAGPGTEDLREALGLTSDARRFATQLRHLDALVDALTQGGQTVIGSWRWRDGAGSTRPPGPWIAGRQREGSPELSVGVDALALATDGGPLCPLELALAAASGPELPTNPELPTSPEVGASEEDSLPRRVRAIRTHEALATGPHTGALGVAVPPARPYSASALQRYAELPYRYFVEGVLGLRGGNSGADGTAALLAREQGAVLHDALERGLATRLAQGDPSGPWLNLVSTADELLVATLDALGVGYRRRAAHGQAEAIWSSEQRRWAIELQHWWRHWQARLNAAMGHQNPTAAPKAAPSGRARSKPPRPEAIETAPGLFLCGVEWSPAAAKSGAEPESESESEPSDGRLLPFELELGDARLPLVAAIDRIEANPFRNELLICDYKTGKPPWAGALLSQLRAGTHLQLPLYGLAVAQVARTDPTRLGISAPAPVGSLRLEYLQRPPRAPWLSPDKQVLPVARGFRLDAPLGVDASGQEQTVAQAAARFALAFAAAIEAGEFPLVARVPARRFGRSSDRVAELARAVPGPGERSSSLPPALGPFSEPRRDREVIR